MKKSLITKIVLVAASVLSIIFLALPFVSEISGYDMFPALEIIGELFGADFAFGLVYIAPLFILIGSIVMLVFSVLALLGEVNVIKNEKLVKVSETINFIVSIVLCALAALVAILILVKGASLGAGLILILLLAVAALVATILDKKWRKA